MGNDDSIVLEEYKTNPQRFLNNVKKLAVVVYNQHYSFIRDSALREDMIYEGYYKGIELCTQGKFDGTKSSLRNYLYTGMRNQMQNFYTKHKRFVSLEKVTEHVLFEQSIYSVDDADEEEVKAEIDDVIVSSICSLFSKSGNYTDALVNKLRCLGFSGGTLSNEDICVDDMLLDALTVEYIWRYAEKYG